ncbi:aminodeoxychorismate lyase [Corynebacterium pseudodiphtheriticum]|uniref:aminodeoxychorismate lyase n=1 Tax=Corynebacterium pseudodiphtheriticum TaxID=37637 RepID=UPI00223AED35|nr:aminodeoxychorismate lyase [Corynebacterium pseudodiphtheriticum]MCT1635956.1 aminodeoxychorismate lyase [Corynebacterium pseudodiphtheriticum]MCT1667116.1 aminodeoxychorismate lyase [Corynebacterium pseudodiphtheriticum]WKS30656.1 aminodeoxychorismate lyase [Corynebacterium pseudodiphtheriticum]WKS52083.1 aminodeoxychorismate lyase [Corynebacterium pseudodiphtheriticum]
MCEQPSSAPLTPVIYTVDVRAGTFRRHDPAQPVVFWDDAAVTRGEAVFESLLVRNGRAANLQRHLDRLQRSAQRMDLPAPDRAVWQQVTAAAVADWQEQSDGREGKCTWTYSRGRQYTGGTGGAGADAPQPTAWLVIAPVAQGVLQQRHDGVRAQLVPRGWTTTVGAKTVNYAATMAALRQAHGFDDVIFVEPTSDATSSPASASDARVLEGATSTVVLVLREGSQRRLVTPAGDVLAGTTVDALFDYARQQGWICENRPVTAGELYQAESVWLISSVRIAVRVTSLGDTNSPAVELPAPANHAEIRGLIEQALSL